jgi:hypothetical protein
MSYQQLNQKEPKYEDDVLMLKVWPSSLHLTSLALGSRFEGQVPGEHLEGEQGHHEFQLQATVFGQIGTAASDISHT